MNEVLEFFKEDVTTEAWGERYAQVAQKGKRIYLELEVEDPIQTRHLLRWLYSENSEKKPYQIFRRALKILDTRHPSTGIVKELKYFTNKFEHENPTQND